MAYYVIRTIKKRRYLYLQRSYRAGGKVRTESIYLGPIEGSAPPAPSGLPPVPVPNTSMQTRLAPREEDLWAAQEIERKAKEQAAKEAMLSQLHARYGLKLGPENPVPVEAPTAPREDAGEGEGPNGSDDAGKDAGTAETD